MSHASHHVVDSERYAKCVEVSKRIRWDIDRDVIRGRRFDFGLAFLPDGLSKADRLPFLTAEQKRFYSQVQGRTYANMFALVKALHRRQGAGAPDRRGAQAPLGSMIDAKQTSRIGAALEPLVAAVQ